MGDIFGSLQLPKWLSPDESSMRWAQIHKGGGEAAFEQGFRNRQMKDAKIDAAKKADLDAVTDGQHLDAAAATLAKYKGPDGSVDSIGFLKAAQEKPSLFTDKAVSPFMKALGEGIKANEKIKNDAIRAEAVTVSERKKLQDNAYFLKQQTLLNPVEVGALADIQTNEVLSNEGRALAIEKLFAGARERVAQSKIKTENQITATQSDIAAYKKAVAEGDAVSVKIWEKKLFPAQEKVAMQTEKFEIPADVTPAKPGKFHLFEDSEPKTPAVTNAPAKTITRRVPVESKSGEAFKSADEVRGAVKTITATDPKTGKKVKFVDGQWIPIP